MKFNALCLLVISVFLAGVLLVAVFAQFCEYFQLNASEIANEIGKAFRKCDAKMDSADFSPQLNDWIQTQIEKPN